MAIFIEAGKKALSTAKRRIITLALCQGHEFLGTADLETPTCRLPEVGFVTRPVSEHL